eukprot:IDg7082t1
MSPGATGLEVNHSTQLAKDQCSASAFIDTSSIISGKCLEDLCDPAVEFRRSQLAKGWYETADARENLNIGVPLSTMQADGKRRA